MVIGRCKVKMLKQVLAKPLLMYGMTVSGMCKTGVCPFPVRGHWVKNAAFHCCMVKYTYIIHTGSSPTGETLEEEEEKKEEEMEANGGKVFPIES
jgi:hypothetical protein